MKKLGLSFCILLIVSLVFLQGCGGGGDTADLRDGVYTGVGQGYGGEIEVKVTVSGGDITEIEVVRETETPGISDNARIKTIERILEEQSTDIDLVTGATSTSRGVREAVTNALANAQG